MDLNLGCGETSIFNSIGVDRQQAEAVEVVGDANELPFRNNAFDTVYMDNILEHNDDIIGLMEEVHRVAKPGAIVHIWVPYGVNRWYVQDPTHSTPINDNTFQYFNPNNDYHYYTDAAFKVVETQYKLWDHKLIQALRIAIPDSVLRDFVPNSTVAMYTQLRAMKSGTNTAKPERELPPGRMSGFDYA